MDMQKDLEFVIALTHEDTHASYVPSSFDTYLMNARMRHTPRSGQTKTKLQSDYASIDVILLFLQIRYKALLCILRLVLTL